MFECEQCGDTGYIPYVAFYDNVKVNGPRACKCLNDFLNQSTPHEIIAYIKKRISGADAKRMPADIANLSEVSPDECPF